MINYYIILYIYFKASQPKKKNYIFFLNIMTLNQISGICDLQYEFFAHQRSKFQSSMYNIKVLRCWLI
jgi:hypothetical protein